MSNESKNLRDLAAKELRKSRNGGSQDAKSTNVKRASAYKSFADNEEWLIGENRRLGEKRATKRSENS